MAENLKYLNDDNFADVISQGVTLVDFYADWCGPCRMIAPMIEELANEMHDRATIAKLDVETAQEIASAFGITSIPTLILFKDGKEIQRIIGVHGKEDLKKMIVSAL